MSGRGNVRKVAAAVIIICLLAMAGFSGIKLYRLICEYRDNQQAYRAVSETAITDDSLKVDFDKLRKINPDVVGWIRYIRINYLRLLSRSSKTSEKGRP